MATQMIEVKDDGMHALGFVFPWEIGDNGAISVRLFSVGVEKLQNRSDLLGFGSDPGYVIEAVYVDASERSHVNASLDFTKDHLVVAGGLRLNAVKMEKRFGNSGHYTFRSVDGIYETGDGEILIDKGFRKEA